MAFKDASASPSASVKENLTEDRGDRTLDQAFGKRPRQGGMPTGVRAALNCRALAASQPFDFKKLLNATRQGQNQRQIF